MRNDIIANGIKKVTKVIDKINNNVYSDDVKKVVKITDRLSLEINGIVNDMEDLIEENGETFENDFYGKVMYFEIYAIKDGKEVDCMTIDYSRNLESDIEYLLNCYA